MTNIPSRWDSPKEGCYQRRRCSLHLHAAIKANALRLICTAIKNDTLISHYLFFFFTFKHALANYVTVSAEKDCRLLN